MNEQEDILASLDLLSPDDILSPHVESSIFQEENITELEVSADFQEIETISEFEEVTPIQNKINIWGTLLFITKYISTSICIFWVLLVASNYSAYWNIASSILFAEQMEQTKQSLIQSVAAASLQEDTTEKKEVNTFRQLESWDQIQAANKQIHDISSFVAKNNGSKIDLGIEVTPYENRIVIPKIGKNIPLLDITQEKVGGVDELNDIFMKELENGVIRYPGSAKPGNEGNSFIFGHSSNFPWMGGEFNDVFALLDKVVFDDEIIVYYGQEKYTYKISKKNVIRPGDVSVLKNDNKDRKQITLMTCWPIGTTLNRLVLTGELIEISK